MEMNQLSQIGVRYTALTIRVMRMRSLCKSVCSYLYVASVGTALMRLANPPNPKVLAGRLVMLHANVPC